MITVKDIKSGTTFGNPVYASKPYVVIGNKAKIVLHAGDLQSIRALSSYYDDCQVKVRVYDLYLNDNTKVLLEGLRIATQNEAGWAWKYINDSGEAVTLWVTDEC